MRTISEHIDSECIELHASVEVFRKLAETMLGRCCSCSTGQCSTWSRSIAVVTFSDEFANISRTLTSLSDGVSMLCLRRNSTSETVQVRQHKSIERMLQQKHIISLKAPRSAYEFVHFPRSCLFACFRHCSIFSSGMFSTTALRNT